MIFNHFNFNNNTVLHKEQHCSAGVAVFFPFFHSLSHTFSLVCKVLVVRFASVPLGVRIMYDALVLVFMVQ